VATFDDIEIRRPALAASYLAMLQAQPGRPLAMFAPRRVGKTYFLDHDLSPAAREAGLLPVYADLWLQRAAPLEAVNHALEEALDDAQVPASRAGKLARTAVKRVGALGASLDLGDAPTRRTLPAAPELRLDALVTRLAQAAGRSVLLMLDEVQALADATRGDAAMASLRAVLHKRRDVLQAVFTGSSQEAMVRMLATVGAPMYQFAQLLNFPVLGDEYLDQLARHFSRVHPGKSLPRPALRQAFERIGFKPGLMRDLVKSLSAEGRTDVMDGLTRFTMEERQVAGWQALLQPYDAFDRAVLQAVALARPVYGRDTLQRLPSPGGAAPTVAKVRAAVLRLRKGGLIAKAETGGVVVDDPLLAEYLRALP
jgi:uncharacterized protein